LAEIVAAFGVPHTPFYPMLVKRDGPQSETAQFFARLRADLERLRPDVIVLFSTDHLNTFFFDNLPIFAMGVTERFHGPVDEPPEIPMYQVPSRPDFAAHLRRACVAAGFDVALTEKFGVDHSFIVPLHFLTPQMEVPVVPIFVSGHVPPLPSARRCFDLGRTIGEAVASWPGELKVAVIGSGSFSLDVFGPLMAPGRTDGVPDPGWAERICQLMEQGEADALIGETTPKQLAKAGNVAGEVLNWIAMLGAIGPRPARYLLPQLGQGHAYAVWEGR
jgi:aromatic ring-opening dioxygenase catalytic subunit (LigB family)